jgi:hypothetical protein
MSTDSPQLYLAPKHVANELNVSIDSVLAWIHSKQLIAIDVSKSASERARWRIERTDLETFIRNRRKS